MVNLNELLHRLIAEFLELENIVGITMSGSKVSNQNDDLSDINLDFYVTEPIPLEKRRPILLKFSTGVELNDSCYQTSDCFILDDFPIKITLSYITLKTLQSELTSVLGEAKAKIGYSTCLIHHFLTSTILIDPHHQLNELQQTYQGQYPDLLKQHIIDLNLPLLKLTPSSYYHQLEQALIRQDWIAILAQVNKFLISYFDILFAINNCYHPGEKRLIQQVKEQCLKYPPELEEKIKQLMSLAASGSEELLILMDNMIEELQGLLN